jgi:hypothetical protein
MVVLHVKIVHAHTFFPASTLEPRCCCVLEEDAGDLAAVEDVSTNRVSPPLLASWCPISGVLQLP